MLANTLLKLFQRDLTRLRNELIAYTDERNIWRIDHQITNSAGNLALHLIGNLNNYIGANLGNSGYIRHRELEFSLKHIPLATLLSSIDDTIKVIEQTLPTISDEAMQQIFPEVIWDGSATTEFVLMHLTTHLSYHLGQVNYHRRLLDVAEEKE